MSYQSIVYGRIISGPSIAENKKIINNLNTTFGFEKSFLWILKEMFSLHGLEQSCSFREGIITFGATYRALESHLTAWLTEFEAILYKLEFDTAKVEIETEICGTYSFFWKSKLFAYDKPAEYEERGLRASEKWYYGYGHRDMWGEVDDTDTEKWMKEMLKARHPSEAIN